MASLFKSHMVIHGRIFMGQAKRTVRNGTQGPNNSNEILMRHPGLLQFPH